jgi:integrase/recombinase XerD
LKKKSNDRFIRYLREYFTVYLPKQKNSSFHTITSCRHTWNLLLKHVALSCNIRMEDISFQDMNRKTVTGFLEQMEKERNWTPATRNQRLGCIRSFFRYATGVEPTLVLYLEDLNGIPLKKGTDKSRVMEFMSQEAVKILLQQPDTSKKSGIRDVFFMVLMYDTAARDCEMLGMRLCDFDTGSKTVYLMGKGSKPRLVPVTDNTVKHFQNYIKVYHEGSGGTEPMFYTIHRHQKSPMSDDNVARFIKKYSSEARKFCSEMPENVHPHMFRRSRAMHLYRSGMPLALLAEWLGHENPETTLIYAYADTEMKRKAIEKASRISPLNVSAETAIWENDEDIIRRLCGLA